MMQEKPNRIFVEQTIQNKYTIRLARDISEPDDFDDELNLLSMAGGEDTVKLLVVSPGGYLTTCNLLTKALRETKARTIGYIGSSCASAATAIILACDEWEIDEQSSFMIHTASLGVIGKAPEIETELQHRLRLIRRWVETTYKGFLSDEEIENVIAGKDYWFEGEELARRLIAYADYREEARQKLYEEDEEEVDTDPEEA